MNRLTSLFVSVLAFGSAVAAPEPVRPRSIPGQWIVALKPESAPDFALHTRWVSDLHERSIQRRGGVATAGLERTFDFPGFVGYSGSFDDDTLAEIRANPNVTDVEPDREVFIASLTSQANPPWGLSAISHANPPRSDTDYIYDETAGADTFAYVLDSGLYAAHTDFEGRAVLGFDATGGATTDHGHGTHVAGIIGGRVYGVAKKTALIGVQVTGSTIGQLSWILSGLDWTARDVAAKGRAGRAVINASLSTTTSAVVNSAFQALIDAGVPVVAAAGNTNSDTASWSPASLPDAITVAASNSVYRRWSASNWGPAVDLFAPGQAIPSAYVGSPDAEYVTSGTSMAAPYVAGVVAYLAALEGPRSPAEVKARILELATRDVIEDRRDAPNLLLYNGNGA